MLHTEDLRPVSVGGIIAVFLLQLTENQAAFCFLM